MPLGAMPRDAQQRPGKPKKWSMVRPVTTVALFPERVLLAEAVASRFGGTRARLVDAPRRIGLTTLKPDADGLDVVRLLSRPVTVDGGQPRRVAALLRRTADVDEAAGPDDGGAPLVGVAAAWAATLAALHVDAVRVVPRLLDAPEAGLVRAALTDAGIVDVGPLVPHAPPASERDGLLFVCDAEVLHWPTWKIVADAGQRAMLAAGLAADVVAAIVAAGGDDGREVWTRGLDDAGRALFVQRVERAIRAADGATVALRVASLVPALASSTSKLAQLQAMTDAPPRALELATQLRASQRAQRARFARLAFELRVPQTRPAWWTERVAGLGADHGIELAGAIGVVGRRSPATDGLITALEAVSVAAGEPPAAWLLGHASAGPITPGSHASARTRISPTTSSSVASAPGPGPSARVTDNRSIGGVRSGVLDLSADVSVSPPATSPAPIASPSPAARGADAPPTGPAPVVIPVGAIGVGVVVDGVAVPDVDVATVGVAGAPDHKRVVVPEAGNGRRSGSVVVVTWHEAVVREGES